MDIMVPVARLLIKKVSSERILLALPKRGGGQRWGTERGTPISLPFPFFLFWVLLGRFRCVMMSLSLFFCPTGDQAGNGRRRRRRATTLFVP